MAKNFEVTLKGARLSFPNLFKPKSVNGSEPKYGASFLIEPGSDNEKAVLAALKEAAIDKWGDKEGEKVLASLIKNDKVCLHDGDKKDYQGYEGMMYISASSDSKPMLGDNRGKEITDPGALYAGCYAFAKLGVWAQDNQFGKRINAELRLVQFMRDGDAFSGAAPMKVTDMVDLGEGAEDDVIGD